MEKMKFETISLVDKNIDKIEQMFPGVVTEVKDADGTIRKAVDFEALKVELSDGAVESRECYEFTWAGKTDAKIEAAKPIRKTLRPCKEESQNWDTTQNLYIEGDNLDVLKLLQENYLNKVKMIYIDPPYNTGNDFVYADDFRMNQDEYEDLLDLTDENDNRMIRNTDSNGRFHSDWCSMMYSRLKLARNLLTDDGVIFISIDDNEQANLKKICDEIFGAGNFAGVILWKKKTNGNNMGILPPVHDYIFCYSKNISNIFDIGYNLTEDIISKTFSNPDNDPRGAWTTSDLSANHKGPYFAIKNPMTGTVHYPPKGRYWVFNEKEVLQRIADGRIIFGKNGEGKPVQKVFLKNRSLQKIRASSWWEDKGMNEDATKELFDLFKVSKIFTHPKPSKLIYNLCKISSEKKDIILDFFSGSATTAHAVMQLNAEDGGNRKFIMVQIPEKCDEKSEAFKAGYKNICEIGKERIRRAGDKILQKITSGKGNLNGAGLGMGSGDGTGNEDGSGGENERKILDIGFRVFKVDDTNMKDVYYTPAELTQDLLAKTESNIKDDRTDLDLLYGCLLDWGLELSMPHETKQVDGCAVHYVNHADLVACFDKNVPETVVRKIAEDKPLRVVFRDSCFENISDKNNVSELFKALSPDTKIKVI